MQPKYKFWVSFATLLIVMAGIIHIGEIVSLKSSVAVENLPTKVLDGDTVRSHQNYLTTIVASEQLGPVDYMLFKSSPFVLWALIYLLYGMVGGVVSMWLEIGGLKAPGEGNMRNSALRLSVSAVSGLLMYFLLLLPGPFLEQWLSIVTDPAVEGAKPTSMLNQFVILPVMAGLFTSTFFDMLEKVFTGLWSPRKGDKK